MIRLLGLLAVFGLASCASTTPAACPARFETFLERFMADTAYQMAAVADPLIEGELAPTLEAGVVETPRPARELEPPLIESRAMLRKEGLVMDVEHPSADRSVVLVYIPESDAYVMRYTFEKRGCWVLTRREDESL